MHFTIHDNILIKINYIIKKMYFLLRLYAVTGFAEDYSQSSTAIKPFDGRKGTWQKYNIDSKADH